MSIYKTIARKAIFPTLMHAGVDKLLRSGNSNSILNITYHGVVNVDGNYFSPRHILKEQFEKQLIYFKRNFDIISIDQAFELRKNKERLIRNAVTISFDDGFKNNLDIVLPLLEKYEVPITFFISSVCAEDMETRCLWPELIATLNYYHSDEEVSIESYKFKNLYDSSNSLYLGDLLKSSTCNVRDEILNSLISKYNLEKKIQNIPQELWKLIDKNELRQLAKSSLVTIGSHGHLHYNLGQISEVNAFDELSKSKSILQDTIDKDVTLFAYPDGNYNKHVIDIAEQVGYNGQLAVGYLQSNHNLDLRLMNRHGISSTTSYESNMLLLSYCFKSKAIKL